jgi:chromosomal replication initiator protein
MALTDTDAIANGLLKQLAKLLPPELADVLLPTVRMRSSSSRVLVTLPNPIWRDVFQEFAADRLRTLAQAKNLTLHVGCRNDVNNATQTMQQRFSNFLQDPGNQLALAACRRAVEAPGLEHNPLYIHGPNGCGKSHLLAAIAAEYCSMLDDQAVVFFHGPDFVAREAQRLTERGATQLRQKIDQAAVIIVDGIDALSNRHIAQEELFHLINSALERGQQLVLAGILAPRRLPEFEDRLVTRLAWGLSVAIESPHSETRVALLRRLIDQQVDDLDNDHIVQLVDTFAPDMHQVVKLAERLIAGERPGIGSDYASFDHIVQVVAEHYDLRPGDLAGKRRHREIAQARQIALLLGRRLTGHSLEALGGMIGGRDHSTVLYSIRQAEERLLDNDALNKVVTEMTQKILDRDVDD